MKTYSAADFKKNKTGRWIVLGALVALFAYLYSWVSKNYASKMVWLYGVIAAVSLGVAYMVMRRVAPINAKEVEAKNKMAKGNDTPAALATTETVPTSESAIVEEAAAIAPTVATA